MDPLKDDSLRFLRLGLSALIFGLVVEAIDLPIAGVDVFHDAAAAVILGVAGWCLAKAARGAEEILPPIFYVPAALLAAGLILDLTGANWVANRFVQIGRFALYVGSLSVMGFAMGRFTGEVGLSSSVKWRRGALQYTLLVLIPGVLIAVFLMPPAPNLPFRHAVGSLDATWWKTGIGYITMALALLATFDTSMAAMTTWKSAGRRIADEE